MINSRLFVAIFVLSAVSILPTDAAQELALPAPPSITRTTTRPAVQVRSPLVPRSPKVRKDKLNFILSRKEFEEDKSSLGEKLFSWLGEAIGKIFGRVFGSGIGPVAVPEGLSLFSTIVAIVLLILLLSYIIAKITGYRRNINSNQPDADDGIYSGPSVPKHALDDAAKMASSGDFRAALRFVYLAILLRLDERDLIRFDRTGTNWEYLSILRKHNQVHDTLKPITIAFDRKWYGHEPAGDIDYQSFVRAYELVEAAEVNR